MASSNKLQPFSTLADDEKMSRVAPLPVVNGQTNQPARPVPAPLVSSMNRALAGTIPGTMQLDSDFAENQYGGQVPSYRLMPPASSGQSAVNSGVLNGSEAAAQAAYQAQQTANAAIAAAQLYAGAYNPLTLYAAGKIVSYNGLLYISLLTGNIGNEPDISPTYWQSTGTGGAFLGDWNSGTAYVIGNQVIDVAGGGGYYIATAANTDKQPSITPGYWTLITAGNLNSYEGAYNAGTAYTVGQIVSYGGAQYIAIQASTGQTPSAASSYWTLLGANALFMGTWSGTTAYTANMIVAYQGNLYQCILANTNETPPNATYWVLTGPATLDDLENGDIYIKGVAYQGQSLVVPNPNFQLADTNGVGIAGWSAYSGATLTAAQTGNPPQTNGTYCEITSSTAGGGMVCGTNFKVAPGDIIFFSAYMISDGTFKIEGRCIFWDGAGNLLSEIDIGNTTSTSWVFYSNTGTAPANTAYAQIYFQREDSAGSNHSAYVTDVQLACSSGVAPNGKSSLLNNQGIPGNPAASVSYASTTSSITWSWASFTLYYLDGSTLTVASGSHPFNGLTSSTTYYFEFYVTISTGIMTCVMSDQSSGQAPASIQFLTQTVGSDGHAIEITDLTAATTASGSGGGGGGGGSCFSGDTRIKTDQGFVRMDCLPSEFVVLNQTGKHRAQLIMHKNSTSPALVMPDGALVTEEHLFQREDGKWVPARELFKTKAPQARRTLYNVHVITENPDDMHYILENGFVAHNKKRQCFSGDARVRTAAGFIRMDELPETFTIVNRDGTFAARLIRHEHCRAKMHRLPGNSLVTDAHVLRRFNEAAWTEAANFLPASDEAPETLFNVHAEGSDFFELDCGLEANHMRTR